MNNEDKSKPQNTEEQPCCCGSIFTKHNIFLKVVTVVCVTVVFFTILFFHKNMTMIAETQNEIMNVQKALESKLDGCVKSIIQIDAKIMSVFNIPKASIETAISDQQTGTATITTRPSQTVSPEVTKETPTVDVPNQPPAPNISTNL